MEEASDTTSNFPENSDLRRPVLSLSWRIRLSFAAAVALVSAGALLVVLQVEVGSPAMVFAIVMVGGLLVGLGLLGLLLGKSTRRLEALRAGMRSFADGDYSVRLTAGIGDEIGELIHCYNVLGEKFRRERSTARQKELMLQTALQSNPSAIVLVVDGGRVVFSNSAARDLFLEGRRLEGHPFPRIIEQVPPELREMIARTQEGLVTLEHRGEQEILHLSTRCFNLNGRKHVMYVLSRLTRELSRQEVEVWKKVIRLISHELNNSLAPVSSLLHSASVLAAQPGQSDQLPPIFDAMAERLRYLRDFLEGYARFARLPKPCKQRVPWREFLDQICHLYPFQFQGEVPLEDGFFDPSQMQQVLINLLKNAHEASVETGAEDQISLRVESLPDGGTRLWIADRGLGMGEEVLSKALLPFYSTKQSGSGLGLPLSREILEAHGGTLRIESRPGTGTSVICWLP
jgi:two-component system, NtrC family, nitrogen regulation sensor histidine kinase NtrY